MWIVEDPWTPSILLFGVGVVAFLLWQSLRKRGLLITSIVCAVVIGLVFLLDAVIVTDAERIETRVVSLVRAVEGKEFETVDEHLSNRLNSPPQLVGSRVRQFANRIQFDEPLRITDIEVSMEGTDRAVSNFRVNGAVVYDGTEFRSPTRWHLWWVREDDHWVVDDYERRDPIKNQKLNNLW